MSQLDFLKAISVPIYDPRGPYLGPEGPQTSPDEQAWAILPFSYVESVLLIAKPHF